MDTQKMKIYAVSVVKNEADIIRENLLHAAKWADKIVVFDNGSTDGTWEIINEIKSNVIIPWKTEDKPFRDELRKEVFDYFRDELNDGDWVCVRLDADEFYMDNPREFLSKLPKMVQQVFGINMEYQFTEDNLKDNDETFRFDKFKYLKIPTCEQRFVKYRKKLHWLPHGSIPSHPGITSKKFIKFEHYQFRSKSQIQKRLSTRQLALDRGLDMYWEEDTGKPWEVKIVDQKECIEVTPDTNFDELVRKSGVKIPETLPKRLIKLIMHGLKIWP